MRRIELRSILGTCTVLIGDSFLIGKSLQEGQKNVFITDQNVFRLYPRHFADVPTIVLETGERTKTLATVRQIYRQLLEMEADRETVIFAMGGGIVCDITGFAASTYMRGLRFNLIPTSLLAQVDAGIGGKNGVNFLGFKNIVGTFAQPDSVLLDCELLRTLPDQEVRCGTAEICKHALIASPELFAFLEQEHAGLQALDPSVVERAVMDSIRIKSKVVEADARESGQRRILNFGHTLAHALEKTTDLTHGQAVGIGMAFAARISFDKELLSRNDKQRVLALLDRMALSPPIKLPSARRLADAVRKDKKRQADAVHFVLLEAIGKPRQVRMGFAELEEHIHDLCQP
jgi:3-dehydroquinate synthase